jgi:hypothetical protein
MPIVERIREQFEPAGSGVLRSHWEQTGRPHVTDVIRRIQNAIGKGHNGKGQFGDSKEVVMEAGFIWEEVFTLVFADRMADSRPGELERDGIVGSPDGVGPDPGGKNPRPLVLEEYKCTWRSSARCPTEDWYWMTQCKAYCAMLELDTVVMRVLYLMGDYRGSGPQYRVFRITYGQKEIDDNWKMIIGYADKMGLRHQM